MYIYFTLFREAGCSSQVILNSNFVDILSCFLFKIYRSGRKTTQVKIKNLGGMQKEKVGGKESKLMTHGKVTRKADTWQANQKLK